MTDPFSAWGEAEREKWKAVQKAVPLTEKAGRFVASIFGPAAIELGGLLTDQMKAWRAANLRKIADKWRAIGSKRPIERSVLKLLPFREGIALVEAASIEDDEDVQELWAKLIANATDVDADTTLSKMHIDLLKSINGLEARILLVQFTTLDEGDFSDAASSKRWKQVVRRWPDLTSEQLRVCLQNLQRLGILAPCITEMEVLKYTTIEEWEKSLTQDALLDEFKKVVAQLVLELTNLTGNPMNDVRLPDDLKSQVALIRSFTLTRLGFDLYAATSQKHREVSKQGKRAKTRRKAP